MIAVENSPIDAIREAISSSFVFKLVEWQRQYPDENALLRMLRLSAPDLLVVDFADMARAMRVVQVVQQHGATTEVLALCEEIVTALSTLLRAGVRNYLTPSHPFEQVSDALRVLAEQLMKRGAGADRRGYHHVSAAEAWFGGVHACSQHGLLCGGKGWEENAAGGFRQQRGSAELPVQAAAGAYVSGCAEYGTGPGRRDVVAAAVAGEGTGHSAG